MIYRLPVITLLFLFNTFQAHAAWEPCKVSDSIEKLISKDQGMVRFFRESRGFVVFPSVGKIGLGLGGAFGKGEVYEQGELIGFAKLKQFSIGFQLGAQKYSEYIFFKNKDSLDDFTEGRFKFSAQVSAVAAKYGASADADYSQGVAVFTLVKGGLMYEATVGGQKFSFEHASSTNKSDSCSITINYETVTAATSTDKTVTAARGTGFFVTKNGYTLTNQHVVNDCRSIIILTKKDEIEAKLISEDETNDIALLKIDRDDPVSFAKFRSGKEIRVGNDIIAIGFPLDPLLGKPIKATAGTLSSLVGYENDTTSYQITAPVQPGNSGGPLLDGSGNVVGIISGKLLPFIGANKTLVLPQNVNFAIKSSIVTSFLSIAEIEFETADSDNKYDRADIIEKATDYVVRVACKE